MQIEEGDSKTTASVKLIFTTSMSVCENKTMKYLKAKNYDKYMDLIMGPNPIKLEEELLLDNKIPDGSTVMDLGSGQGLTSVFLAKEYGFRVYAADLWSDPEEKR